MKKAGAKKAKTKKKNTTAEAAISEIKKNVRKKVMRGEPLSSSGRTDNLESREVQIKIAELEIKAARETRGQGKKRSMARSNKIAKEAEALKHKLK